MTDGQKLLANEQTDCSRAGLAQASPLVPIAVVAWMASMAPMAPMAPMVPEAVTPLLAPTPTIGILQPRLQLAATPRETDGFRSLRRVDKIGMRMLKVPAKLMENELMDCFTKLVKNELLDCLAKLLAKLLLE